MIEKKGNLWELAKNSVLCITTNGFIKKNGNCVMGRGIAKQAAQRWPQLPKILAKCINTYGNSVSVLGRFDDYVLLSFPVKPRNSYEGPVVAHMKNKFNKGDLIPGWACTARKEIIQKSIAELSALCRNIPANIYLPRPGCGAGELKWEEVRPLFTKLPDKYIVCTY